MRAVPNKKLGLAMNKQEFIISLRIWLGIAIFPSFPDAIRCTCGQILGQFGDHLLSCGHGNLRTKRHDSDFVMSYFMLFCLTTVKLVVSNRVTADLVTFITLISHSDDRSILMSQSGILCYHVSMKLHFDLVWLQKLEKEIKTAVMKTSLPPVEAFSRMSRLLDT